MPWQLDITGDRRAEALRTAIAGAERDALRLAGTAKGRALREHIKVWRAELERLTGERHV